MENPMDEQRKENPIHNKHERYRERKKGKIHHIYIYDRKGKSPLHIYDRKGENPYNVTKRRRTYIDNHTDMKGNSYDCI